MVVRRLKHRVGNQNDGNAVAGFEFCDFSALFVQKVGRYVDGHLSVQGPRAFLRCFFLQNAQHLQRAAFRVADDAHAVAAGTRDVMPFGQGGTQTLTRQFHQAETADAADLHAGAVRTDGVTKALFDFALIARFFHVDEVDDDEAAQVTKAHLTRHFFGGFDVRLQRRFFDVRTARGAGRVDVHRHQGFRVVDHDGAARGQRYRTGIRRLDLMLDLKTREEGRFFSVALHAAHHVGHDVGHELTRLLVNIVRIDEDFADVGLEVVADCADDEVALFNDEERCGVGAL